MHINHDVNVRLLETLDRQLFKIIIAKNVLFFFSVVENQHFIINDMAENTPEIQQLLKEWLEHRLNEEWPTDDEVDIVCDARNNPPQVIDNGDIRVSVVYNGFQFQTSYLDILDGSM